MANATHCNICGRAHRTERARVRCRLRAARIALTEVRREERRRAEIERPKDPRGTSGR
jgi:hypothetical protein